jgi:hypothetical protein
VNGKNYLSQVATVQLGKMLEKDYQASKMSDAAFAALASVKLGSNITASNVFTLRRALKIPANRTFTPPSGTITGRLEAIERFLDGFAPEWRDPK